MFKKRASLVPYFLWEETTSIPLTRAIKTLILQVSHLESNFLHLQHLSFFKKIYYTFLTIYTKRTHAYFTRFFQQRLLSFHNKDLVSFLKHHSEHFGSIPKMFLAEDLFLEALKPYIPKNAAWIMVLYDQDPYTHMAVFHGNTLIIKRRFLEKSDLKGEIQATAKFLSRHHYQEERLFAYYLNGKELSISLPEIVTLKRVPCERDILFLEALKNIETKRSLKYPLRSEILEPFFKSLSKRALFKITLPCVVLSFLLFIVHIQHKEDIPLYQEKEYNALTQKNEKVLLFEKLSELNQTPYTSAFLKVLKSHVTPHIPISITTHLKKKALQLTFSEESYIVQQKAVKLRKALKDFDFQIHQSTLTITPKVKKP